MSSRKPGRSIAVIGAGISGVCTAAHLIRLGHSVTVFERSDVSGGVWHFDPRSSLDPPYPSSAPSSGDYVVSQPGEYATETPPPDVPGGVLDKPRLSVTEDTDAKVSFSPPGPCYSGLKNNVPTNLMVSSLSPWPAGTEGFVSQKLIEEYVQFLSDNHGVDQITLYNTRVEDVRKSDDESHWRVRYVSLTQRENKFPRISERVSQFSAVVVASGHYNMPRIPSLPGLQSWKTRFPYRIIHSKQYRNPQVFKNATVLVIGGGVSSLDICRELDGVAGKTFQSVRGLETGNTLPVSMLPEKTERICDVARFNLEESNLDNRILSDDEPIPGEVFLTDGRVLTGIHWVVLGTGYITSYPFLSHLHQDSASASAADPHAVVTSEGDMTHNLHKDIFYIEDPTLAFVGVPYYIATFSLFDFQAQVVARVFSGYAQLPNKQEMRNEYASRVEKRGLGRRLHSLRGGGQEIAYVNDLVEWMNSSVELVTEGPMQGHTDEWIRVYWEMQDRVKKLWGE